MDRIRFEELFTDIFAKNGIEEYATARNIDLFAGFAEFLMSENEKYNLTALREIEKIIPLHFADCALVADLIPQGASVLDIGCGGGFPTIPLAIIRPDISICGLDSTAKKLNFIDMAAKNLGLTNISTLTGRAEELIDGKRESYDIVISRAVARLNILTELCIPFVKVDGKFIAMKGAAAHEEIREAVRGALLLGGQISTMQEHELITNEASEKRVSVITVKTSPTPPQYPRAFGAIKKKPL